MAKNRFKFDADVHRMMHMRRPGLPRGNPSVPRYFAPSGPSGAQPGPSYAMPGPSGAQPRRTPTGRMHMNTPGAMSSRGAFLPPHPAYAHYAYHAYADPMSYYPQYPYDYGYDAQSSEYDEAAGGNEEEEVDESQEDSQDDWFCPSDVFPTFSGKLSQVSFAHTVERNNCGNFVYFSLHPPGSKLLRRIQRPY